MSYWRTLFYFIALFLVFPFVSCEKEEINRNQPRLRFITEEYNPFNYTDNARITGLAPELLREICSLLEIESTMEVLPWEEGFNETLKTENAVLFTTTLNSTRKDLFKWAGPFASLDWIFYAASTRPVSLKTLEEAKEVGTIGVVPDYAMTEYLEAEGFTNLVYCTDIADAFTQLLNGAIDLFPSDQYTLEQALTSLGESVYSVIPQLTIKTELLYFAFNKSIADAVVSDFQEALNECKKNGVLKQLTQNFLHTSDYPDIFQIYTESYPPLTFMNEKGEISGYGSDIVREIMKRLNWFYPIRLSSWSNGYQLALNNPNFCLFTMDRTAIRENLFQWVGPIGTNTTRIYTRAGSGISVVSLEDAKNLATIGTVESWFSTQYLEEQGFTNLISEDDPVLLTEKLMNGQLEAFVCSELTFPDILAQLNHSYEEVTPVYELMSSDFYVAFSNSTPGSVIADWQEALMAMKNDGTYHAIGLKWFPKLIILEN
jgi:ABC-type amino acid transport substrate-binding protein